MHNNKLSRFDRPFLAWFTLLLLLHSGQALAGHAELAGVYRQLQTVLEKNAYGIPVYIHSTDHNNSMTGSIYGIIQQPFSKLAVSISKAANWCDIAPQHLNIKACTYQVQNGKCHLNFYSGRKFYEKADDVYQLAYQFDVRQQSRDYVHIGLSADEGPAGTSRYQLDIKAIPIDQKRSFIYFSYSYHYNFITSMGMGTYLATLGSGKVGFSIIGKDEQGKPVYIDGVRGIIERNAVRYYLAIQSYLETQDIDQQARFESRISRWFDLTEQHHRQLYEMDKADYLQFKRQERQDQQRLQKAIRIKASEQHICR